ncbi:hypothetical protein LZC95_00425 [Pendulispora brunnea]|uniref:Cytochrome c domain-containing protein n=1 Tax=Pendulispora brunnea TaxID=2905690 RepID=A0ABZ2KEK8_9BACT
MKTRLLLIALITAIAGMGTSLAACSSDDDSNNGGGNDAGKDTSPPGNDSGGNSGATFTQVYDQVISQKCTSCHAETFPDGGPRTPAGGLLLKPKATAHQNLVDKTAPGGACKTGDAGTANIKLVAPNDSENSLLSKKIRPNPPCGGQMPLNKPALSDSEVELIDSWIENGAKDN